MSKMSKWHDELEVSLLQWEEADLHCDGMTYVLSYILRNSDITHHCYTGYVKDKSNGDLVAPHCWIKLEDGWIIDFRLRMWLGDKEDIPHGVFQTTSWPQFDYQMMSVLDTELDKEEFEIFIDKI